MDPHLLDVFRRRRHLLPVLVVLMLAMPALLVGYVHDDWFQMVEQLRHPEAFLGLYEFIPQSSVRTLMERGFAPWFTSPELKIVFLRPFTSLSLMADSRLFGHRALPAHLHSLIWYVIVVDLARRFHRRLLPLHVRSWATLLFALASAHADALTWLAARHVLLGTAFGLGCLLLHVASERLTVLRALASATLLGIGLLCSETALGAVAYVLCYEAWGRGGSLSQRMGRSAPVLAITSGYLVYYVLAGYGVAHAGGYVSPFQHPIGFAEAVVQRLPVLLAELWVATPSLLYNFDDAARLPLAVLGGLSTLAVCAAMTRRREAVSGGPAGTRLGSVGSGSLSWVWAGTFLSLIPVCGSIISGRVLLFPLLGSSCVLAILAKGGRIAAPDGQASAGWALRWTIFGMHLGLAPLLRLGLIATYASVGRAEKELVPQASLACAEGAQTLVVNGSDPTIGMYLPALLALTPAQRGEASGGEAVQLGPVRVLSMASSSLLLHRSGERELIVSTEGPRRSHVIERLYRSPAAALQPGDRVQLSGFAARVLEVSKAGPTKVAFTTTAALDSPEICLVRWTLADAGGRLESFSVPIGETIHVPFVPGAMGL